MHPTVGSDGVNAAGSLGQKGTFLPPESGVSGIPPDVENLLCQHAVSYEGEASTIQ